MKKYLVICLSVMLLVSVLMIPVSAAGEDILLVSEDGSPTYLADQQIHPGDYTIAFDYEPVDGTMVLVSSDVFTIPELVFVSSEDGIDLYAAEVDVNLYYSDLSSSFTFTFARIGNRDDSYCLIPLSLDDLMAENVSFPFTPSFFLLKPVIDIPDFVETVTTDVTTFFSGALGMVKKVAEVFTSNPILYLPIVIGLCGIGVAFYKRLRQ